MRAWENRPDTMVIDEPLYAHYLKVTGVAHPGAAEVTAHGETDWRRVVVGLLRPLAPGKVVFYQKHMAHHLLPGIEREWLAELSHCFLIREPSAMLTSLRKVIPNPQLEDTGLPQQVEIFNLVKARTGEAPPALDARDVLERPESMLRSLCARLSVPFSPRMLHWPAGARDTDGVWGKHWYHTVWQSTGFEPYLEKRERVPSRFRSLLRECDRSYRILHEHRLRGEGL